MSKWNKRNFTLIEVLAALAILAAAVTATMYVLSGSAWRVQRAESFRNESHRLANAVEFFMLYPPGSDIEQKFFPYENQKAMCSYEEPELPEGFEVELNGQCLSVMVVEILDTSTGKTVSKIAVDRIVEAEK